MNIENGLVFNSNVRNSKITPPPMSLQTLVLKTKYRKGGYKLKPFYIVNPCIDDNEYKREFH